LLFKKWCRSCFLCSVPHLKFRASRFSRLICPALKHDYLPRWRRWVILSDGMIKQPIVAGIIGYPSRIVPRTGILALGGLKQNLCPVPSNLSVLVEKWPEDALERPILTLYLLFKPSQQLSFRTQKVIKISLFLNHDRLEISGCYLEFFRKIGNGFSVGRQLHTISTLRWLIAETSPENVLFAILFQVKRINGIRHIHFRTQKKLSMIGTKGPAGESAIASPTPGLGLPRSNRRNTYGICHSLSPLPAPKCRPFPSRQVLRNASLT
jgi:hypothetical protein